MKQKKTKLAMVAGLLWMVSASSSNIQAAAFSLPTSLINIPVAGIFKPGEFEIGTSVGYNSKDAYEFDYKLFFSPTDKLKLGVTLVNYHQLVASIHATFFQIPKVWNLRVGAGLLYITSDKTLSTWEEYQTDKLNNFSNYLVGSVDILWGRYHFGFGKKRFQSTATTYNGITGELQSLGGIFGGFEYTLYQGRVMAEFDGNDFNVGYRLPIGTNADVSIAVTELTREGSTSDDGTPREYSSIGFTVREVFNPFTFQQIAAKEAASIKKTTELEKTNTELKQQVIEITQKTMPPVVTPEKQAEGLVQFNTALRFKEETRYIQAITYLSKAIDADPTVARYYIERGQLYYGKSLLNSKDPDWKFVKPLLLEKAKEDWQKARQLNPDDPGLLKLSE